MYNFIFWFFYKYFEWKDRDDSLFIPASLVAFTIVIHFLALISILELFTGRIDMSFNQDMTYGQRKLVLLPVALVFMYLIYALYYKKRGKSIIEKYDGLRFLSFKNIILIILYIILPLAFVIYRS